MLSTQLATQDVALCHFSGNTTIEILRSDHAQDGHLPPSFFPGAGSDGALFKVIGSAQPFPSYGCICDALNRWDGDTMLIRYDENTGEGYFRLVDSFAPESGAVIELPLSLSLDDESWDDDDLWDFEMEDPNAHYVDPKQSRQELMDYLLDRKIDGMCVSALLEIDVLCEKALQRIESITLYN